jgi:hypothetical protein
MLLFEFQNFPEVIRKDKIIIFYPVVESTRTVSHGNKDNTRQWN